MEITVQRKKSRIAGKLLRGFIVLFILMNVIAAFHAYRFTHFDTEVHKKRKSLPLSVADKVSSILFGLHNPRSENKAKPTHPYKVVKLQSTKELEAWLIPAPDPKGTVLLFHGYGGDKSAMLDKAEAFFKLGYNTFLLDFMGAGNSEGNQTTIGYYESQQVKTAYDFIKNKGEQNLILFGTSMGAVSILKAINDYHIQPQSVIIQSPFGTLYKTVCTRFEMMHLPAFPMAGLLVFWGGLENGFWGFSHKPVEYAKAVNCPILLMYGEQDVKVSRKEIDAIYKNLPQPKVLKTFPQGGHENLLKYKEDWENTVFAFIDKYHQPTTQQAKAPL